MVDQDAGLELAQRFVNVEYKNKGVVHGVHGAPKK
mgnify:CR=1 FL=1|jgi:hypothetical protein